MKKILFCLILLVHTYTHIQAQEHPIIVSPKWLNDHLQDPNLVILQSNFIKLDYYKEHIAGARFLWPGWLAPDSPEGSMNVPDPKAVTSVLRSLGISRNSHIVLCHVRNEVPPTARMFLMLEYLGFKNQVSFLNGGLEAWKKEGYPVTKDVPIVKKGNIKVKDVNPIVVDRHYVKNNLQSENVTIVDARFTRFYDGDPTGNPRDGHITGAKNIPYNEMIDQTNQFKTAEELQNYFTPVATKDREIVTYCFIGQTASVVYLAGRILGYNMKLYDGSLQEWSRIEELPMELTQK
jgi:thiosulfate/3-mercaptopyruvate sulfurtransferase